MSRVTGCIIGLLLALRFAAAQEPPVEPPPVEQPPVEQPRETTATAPAADPLPLPSVKPTEAQNSICMLLESAARANGLPVEFFARVIWQESRFRADAIGPVTRSGQRAQGIAQFMPGTAAERNLLDPFDPIQALPKSAEFLRELRAGFGNLGLAAAAYNAGPRRVREWLAGTGGMPSETRNYVYAITGASVEEWARAGDGGAADHTQQAGRDCGTLVALLKRAPTPFVAALERRVALGAMKPWGAILGANRSRDRVLNLYATLQRRHAAALTGRDPIVLERRRTALPRFQIRIGAETRSAANDLCDRIRKGGGDCVVLRNPKG